jgi:outer membrane protein OmpA-like peptidoglycan-associated protein
MLKRRLIMTAPIRNALKSALFVTSALGGLSALGAAHGQTLSAASASSADTLEEVVVTAQRTTRSSVVISGVEAQKILPGISPLKAIETLPGVIFETSDPWGNNEQNEALVIHGFTTQQLGYTLDGVPLGDQQYGNYNGLSVSRAISSENVGRVNLSTGAGSLGVASTSNLGGAIETYSVDPMKAFNFELRETGGSYGTNRTFVKVDTGTFGDGNTAYVSYLHQDAKAWDFDGRQGGDQVNAKFVHDDETGKLTVYLDWQAKVEPNEDATNFGNQQTATSTYFPYTRPFLYPNLAQGLAYLSAAGAPPAVYGNNFSNYFSAAQRNDGLAYVNYDWHVSDAVTWSNQVYYHNDSGRGIVAGPVNQAGLPGLFAIYFPGQNLVSVFGGTGYEVRTTEYNIARAGERSTLNWDLGDHHIEAGLWYEHNDSAQGRRWYPFSAANNDLTPYEIPTGPAFTQYDFKFRTTDVQLHLQDAWQITPDLLLQAGWKASLQTAADSLPVQQKNLPATNPQVNYPVGSITSNDWFLPQVGAVYDLTDHEQLFVNAQKNMRQYVPYGAGGNFFATSPWSLGSQLAFNTFKATAKPETSWTYEGGIRTKRDLDLGFISAIEGQINYYHVNFSNRLFNVATYSFINPNPSILVNVGGVTTDGADVAATLHFGEHFQFYNGGSYNKSTYDSNYSTVTNGVATIVPLAGKSVPLEPNWLYKFVASTNFGPFEAQINGDYIGKRYVTYLNDLSVASTFVMGLEVSYNFGDAIGGEVVKNLKLSGNVTNLADTKGVSTAVVTSASGGYQAYPLAPRMFFLTLQGDIGVPSVTQTATTTYTPPAVQPPMAPVAHSYQVFFDFNKSDLTPEAVKVVDQAAANAAPAKVTRIDVTGHTDTVGSDAYNMRLSRRRAESVAAELEARGIPSSEIAIFAKGKKDLLVPTADGVREPQNRRVQIVYEGGPTS